MNKRYTLADLYVNPDWHIEKCNECGAEPRWEVAGERYGLYCEKCNTFYHSKATHHWYTRCDAIQEWNKMNKLLKGGTEE